VLSGTASIVFCENRIEYVNTLFGEFRNLSVKVCGTYPTKYWAETVNYLHTLLCWEAVSSSAT